MRDQMIRSLKSRFVGIEDNQLLSVATLINSRFKDRFLIVILQKLVQKTCCRKK